MSLPDALLAMSKEQELGWPDRFELLLKKWRDCTETVWLPRIRVGHIIDILDALEPIRQSGRKDLRQKIGLDRLAFNCAVSRGSVYGLVNVQRKTIEITQIGRWHIIAYRLGLSLAGLCVVADIYVHQAGMHKIGMNRYVKGGSLNGRLNSGHRNLKNIYTNLTRKGYVRCRHVLDGKYQPNLICMNDAFLARLHEYMGDLVRLQFALWRFGIPPELRMPGGRRRHNNDAGRQTAGEDGASD